jgi:hypothetical protein
MARLRRWHSFDLREVYLPEGFFDDQIIEIPCRHCLTTSPKTIAWVRATDRYNCAGCNGPIVVERDALLAAALAENLRLARQ